MAKIAKALFFIIGLVLLSACQDKPFHYDPDLTHLTDMYVMAW